MKHQVLALSILFVASALFPWHLAAADEADFEVVIDVAPNMILLGADQGEYVTVHAEIPFSAVRPGTATLNGIPVDFAFADNRGEYVGKFLAEAVKGTVSEPETEMLLLGVTEQDEVFAGRCVVMVREREGTGNGTW